MLVRIISNKLLQLDQVTMGIEPALIEQFSARLKSHRFIDTKEQEWDGVYRRYNKSKQQLARPFLEELKTFCNDHDFPIEIIDDRPKPKFPAPSADQIDKNWITGIQLEDYQLRCLHSCCSNEVGIHKHPTGAGKTEMMAGIVKMFRCPTVIIASQRIVIEQIKERLDLRDIFDCGTSQIGLFYGGQTPDGQLIVIGSIQSLTTPPASLKEKKNKLVEYRKKRKRAKQFQALVGAADLLIVDECDGASDARYKRVFRHYFKGRRRHGFSATPFDVAKPVQGLYLREHFGSIISTSSRAEVEKTGRIVPIKYVAVVIGEDGNKKDKTAFDIAESEQMIDNPSFHERIKRIVNAFPNDRTLILVDTSNIERLGHKLEETISGSVFIYGKTTKVQRRRAITAFENGELSCLIGGKILKRGLDLKGGVDNLILCGGGKLASNFDQSIGRAVRVNSRGWARVFDFYFVNNHYLYKHSRARIKSVVEMGYDARVIFRGQEIEAKELVKRRFRKPQVRKGKRLF